MNPKVSVLVPIYNSSKFIEKCALSLFNQTFKDIEFIFINDATPDNSIEILNNTINNYPSLKKNIKIINHSSNKGSAAARNTAIDKSTGEFIVFVDSDDYIEPEMIEVLYNKAIASDADIVVCDYYLEELNKTKLVNDYISDSKINILKNVLEHKITSSSLWNKLVKSSLYHKPDCRVPEQLNYSEDWYVMTRLYYYANKIVKVDIPLYHYNQLNINSITKSISRMHFLNIIQFWESIEDFFVEKNEIEQYQAVIDLSKVQSKVQLLINTNSTNLRKEFGNMFYIEETKCLNYFKRGEKLMLLLVRYKLFCLAQMFHNILVIKNKKIK